jgi:hypothetical protein
MNAYAKGERPRDQEDRAKGGAVLGRVRDFMKEEDQFRAAYHGDKEGPGDRTGDITSDDNKYGKSGEGAGKGMCAAPPARGKSLKAIKPRT